MLMKELIKLEAENPEFKRVDSPSNRVGGMALDKFDQVTHKNPMLSLSNAYSAEDLRDFEDNLIDKINYHSDKYYNQDTPEISDFEYDMLMKELIKLEAENTEFKRV